MAQNAFGKPFSQGRDTAKCFLVIPGDAVAEAWFIARVMRQRQ
jgi:hypothetical protein